MDTHVKKELANAVQAAKEDLQWKEDQVKNLERGLEAARKARDLAQAKFNALQRYYNDHA